MKRQIAAEVRMNNGIVLVIRFVSRVDGFHAGIEAKDEIAEVKPQPEAVGHGYLLKKRVKAELPAWLVAVTAQRPDVAGINEESSVQLPEEMRAISALRSSFMSPV